MSKTNKKGIPFRNVVIKQVPKGRNWTEREAEIFCSILADGEFNFVQTSESNALKNKPTRKFLRASKRNWKLSLTVKITSVTWIFRSKNCEMHTTIIWKEFGKLLPTAPRLVPGCTLKKNLTGLRFCTQCYVAQIQVWMKSHQDRKIRHSWIRSEKHGLFSHQNAG